MGKKLYICRYYVVMKNFCNYLVASLGACLISFSAWCQTDNSNWIIGVKVGPNLSMMSLGGLDRNIFFGDVMFGVHGGAVGGYRFSDKIAMLSELTVSKESAKINFYSIPENTSLNSVADFRYYATRLCLPVYERFYPIERLSIELGVQYSATVYMQELLNCSTSAALLTYPHDDYRQFNKKTYSFSDFSLMGGVSVEVRKFTITARYIHGFVPVIKTLRLASELLGAVQCDDFNGKNRVVQISFGYIF